MTHVPLSIHSKDSAFIVRCYSAGIHDGDLKYAVVAESEQLVVGTHTNMVKEGVILTLNEMPVRKCEHSYRRIVSPVGQCRWLSALIMSKDPRILWQDDDDSLLIALKRLTETPLLPAWIPYVGMKLRTNGYLVKLTGHGPTGSFLTVTTELLDGIVSHGVAEKILAITD